MTTVSVVLDSVSAELLDKGRVRWLLADLLRWYNAVIDETVGIKPDCNVKKTELALIAGVARQPVPADCAQFRRLGAWCGTTGGAPSSQIIPVALSDMDACVDNWRATAGTKVENFVFDPEEQSAVYVYPQTTGYVEWIYAATIVDATATTDTFSLSDTYVSCIVAGVLAMAYAANTLNQDLGRSQYWRQRYSEFLGLKMQGQQNFTPKGAGQ